MTTPGTGPTGDVLVLFGITGDLAKKMIIPALYRLVERGELTVPVVGVALTDWGTEQLRAHVADCVYGAFDASDGDHSDRADSGGASGVDDGVLKRLQDLVQLVAGDYADPTTFQRLAAEVAAHGGADAFAVYYLAVPPSLFGMVADGLAAAGLHERARLVVEKPFGHDLDSARALNALLRKNYADDRIFRVDHYLGKEPVEDLLVLRFANTLLEPLWTRMWIDHIEITMAESFDVADRGSFYDSVGTVRDVVQNHLLQVLAYLGMDAPSSDSAADQRDAKFQLLKSVRAVDPADVVRGQYTGYRDVKGVAPGSTTETYVALTLLIDNWRWTGVPVRIVAGKALPTSVLDIVVTLRQPPRSLFAGPGDSPAPPNRIKLRLQPDAGVAFVLLAKQPGGGDVVTEVPIAVDFREVLGPVHAPYERIFGDALVGDPAHFASMDSLEEAWRIVAPILDPGTEPLPYEPGTWGPA